MSSNKEEFIRAPPVSEADLPKQSARSRKRPVNVVSGPTLVMDMSWSCFMDDHLMKKVVSQISMAYSFNKSSANSLPIAFTSMNDEWRALFKRVNGDNWNRDMVTFSDAPVHEKFRTEELVYLTADTDNVCTKLDPGKCYVIGCLLDHNSKKGVTRDFALKHGIRMERLPISEHIKMDGRQVLTINHVAEILIRFCNNGADWGRALVDTIPARKNPRLLEEDKPEPAQQPQARSRCNIQ